MTRVNGEVPNELHLNSTSDLSIIFPLGIPVISGGPGISEIDLYNVVILYILQTVAATFHAYKFLKLL